MQIVRFNEIRGDRRPDGRVVRKLISHKFKKPVDSIVLYLCDVPKGKFGKHHHSKSDEIIVFPKGGKIAVNGKEYEMKPWDFVLLEKGDTHGLDSETQDTIHFAIKCPDVDDKVND